MTDDPVMREIQAAIALSHAGEQAAARQAFEAIWREILGAPEPFHTCVLSHFMADLQDTVEAELAWDLRAYQAALRCAPEDGQALAPGLSVDQFMPSLRLNLADAHLRRGQTEAARSHLEAAIACLEDTLASPYFDMIRGGVARMEQRLAKLAPPADPP